MIIGRLRVPVAIERATTTDDSFGTPQQSWASVGTYRCESMTVASLERVIGQQVRAEATHGLRFRYEADIRPGDRLVWGGRTIYVDGVVDPDGRRIAKVVTCKERQLP